MKMFPISMALSVLRQEYLQWKTPAVTIVAACDGSPFKVLISCLISLRTKDEVTAAASVRLFAVADTPQTMCKLSVDEISALIYPAGFYRNKAVQIREISCTLGQTYAGVVPAEIDELLRFKGVGRKTANLVRTLGYGLPGICVDTHVHRICNRWGYVETQKPDETEMALRGKLQEKYWLEINDLLVAFGQNVCLPTSPFCSKCRLSEQCPQRGVQKSR